MKSVFRFLGSLWNGMRAVQSFVGTLLFILLIVIIVRVMYADDTPHVPNGAALVIAPQGFIVEQRRKPDPFQSLAPGPNMPPQTLLRDVVAAIKHGAADDRIAALVLNFDRFAGTGPSNLHYISETIEAFKESGKPVIAVGLGYTQSGYLLASVADEIYMHPYGGVLLSGYARYRTYFKSAMDKVKVEAQVFRAGAFKSLSEPYKRDNMSEEAKIANHAYLDVLWASYLDRLSETRQIAPETMTARILSIVPDLRAADGHIGNLAVEQGLIDGLMERDQWQARIAEIVGTNKNGKGYKHVGMDAYLAANGFSLPSAKPQVAVIVAQGIILDGEHPAGTIGGDTLARHLRNAREDDRVKAIVLRISSGGGSAFASEVIRREVVLAVESGKPVIASMGTVAASGGYWIAASADEIWASPTTITGSIGVTGMIPNIEGTLDMLGIHEDGIGTTPLAGAATISRALSDDVKALLQMTTDRVYRQFLELVASARGMTPEAVHEIAQGRVWAGATAVEIGLVDQLGSIEDAIASAARRADITDFDLIYVEDKPSYFDQVLADMLKKVGVGKIAPTTRRDVVTKTLTRIWDQVTLPLKLNDPQGVYVLCMDCDVQ